MTGGEEGDPLQRLEVMVGHVMAGWKEYEWVGMSGLPSYIKSLWKEHWEGAFYITISSLCYINLKLLTVGLGDSSRSRWWESTKRKWNTGFITTTLVHAIVRWLNLIRVSCPTFCSFINTLRRGFFELKFPSYIFAARCFLRLVKLRTLEWLPTWTSTTKPDNRTGPDLSPPKLHQTRPLTTIKTP